MWVKAEGGKGIGLRKGSWKMISADFLAPQNACVGMEVINQISTLRGLYVQIQFLQMLSAMCLVKCLRRKSVAVAA